MTETVDSEQIDALLAPLRAAPEHAAVLADIDGTLAPIVDRPEQAAVPEAVRVLLGELAGRYALVGCVSGRRAAEARALVGAEGLVYVGNHGLELLAPDAVDPETDPAVAAGAARVAAFVAGLDHDRLTAVGLRVEDKGPIQSLHWRGAASVGAAELEAREIAAAAQASGVVARWGRKVLELRPLAEVDKGSAIERLLSERGSRWALYGGDDRTDLDAFRALRAMVGAGRLTGAVCVGVESGEEPAELPDRADLLVAGTGGFRRVLERLRR